MPSQSRQRQQRVRHEAGSFVPRTNEDLTNKLGGENQLNIENCSNQTCKDEVPETEDSKEADNKKQFEKQYNDNQKYVINDKRSKDERKNNCRSNERGKGNRSFKGQGRGRSEHEGCPRRSENSRPKTTNVAVAEEKEYEPVMIMEPKGEKKKEPELPQPAKYRRSEVISNWLQYEELPSDDEPDEGEDYLLGEDFSHILNSNVNKSAGGFLHLKGEMSWGKLEQSQFGSHGLGALKVTDLVAALSTIPLHVQLKIPEESLPAFTVSTLKSSADKTRKNYEPNQQYVTDIEINKKILESLKLNENEPLHLSAEEPKLDVAHDSHEATLKFSSAFKPEPSDVDLDSFIRENTPEYSSQVKVTFDEVLCGDEKKEEVIKSVSKSERQNKMTPQLKVSEHAVQFVPDLPLAPKSNDVPKLPEPPQQNIANPSFSFGLSNLTSNNKVTASSKSKSTCPSKGNKKEKVKEESKIDLDKPTIAKKEAPILVKKSEVENLEDWLDSVLDD